MSVAPLRIRAPNKPVDTDESGVSLVPAKNGIKKSLSWRPKLTNVRVYTPVSAVSSNSRSTADQSPNAKTAKSASPTNKRRRTRRGRKAASDFIRQDR